MSYQRAEVSEQYKQAVREYLEQSSEFNRGRMSGLATSLGCLGVSISDLDEMCHICEEEVKDARAQEDVGPGDVNYDEEGFVKERSVSPKEWTAYCDKCGKPFNSKDAVKIPYNEYPGASVSYEDASPCCGTGFSDRPKEEDDIYECEHCNATFSKSEILYREYGGEIGGIAFCPRCKEETKLICVTDLVEART